MKAVRACANRFGLERYEDRADLAMCSALPTRARAAQSFVASSSLRFKTHYGSLDKFVGAMVGAGVIAPPAGGGDTVSKTTLWRWIRLVDAPLRPIAELNSIRAKLAKLARFEFRKRNRRAPTTPLDWDKERLQIAPCLQLLEGGGDDFDALIDPA
jgi:hypothetical protein